MKPSTTPKLVNTTTIDNGNGQYTITRTFQYELVTTMSIAGLQAKKDAIEETIQQLPKIAVSIDSSAINESTNQITP